MFMFKFQSKECFWNHSCAEKSQAGSTSSKEGFKPRGLLSQRCHASLPHKEGLLLESRANISSLIRNCFSAPIRGIQTCVQASRPPLYSTILRARPRGVELHSNILNHFHQWCGIQKPCSSRAVSKRHIHCIHKCPGWIKWRDRCAATTCTEAFEIVNDVRHACFNRAVCTEELQCCGRAIARDLAMQKKGQWTRSQRSTSSCHPKRVTQL